MPTGARKVSRDFSAASIKTTKTNWAVKNISRKTPCAMEVLGPSVVFAIEALPGNMALTRPPAHIAAMIWEGNRNSARIHGS